MDATQQVTQLLLEWGEGDKAALEKLVPIVHDELRRLARNYMRRERAGHTLQTTALINEAYLRLVDGRVAWKSRSHFFGIAARLMRQILVDHARAVHNLKRGGDQLRVSLSEAAGAGGQAAELIALDDALKTLAALDERQCRIVELRYFSGLSIDWTAEAMNISTATVEREWRSARAWLRNQMTR
jgi:RNA polymerase sigma-70 factor (ECF subfamily)